MSRPVKFNDSIVEMAKRVAPAYEFSQFAQMAVRNEIDRRMKEAQQ